MKTTQSEDADAKTAIRKSSIKACGLSITISPIRRSDSIFSLPRSGSIPRTSRGLSKSRYGINFTSLLTRKRLTKAVLLIDEGEDLVSRISYEVGFSDPYYFSKVFKKTYGMTPRDYIGQVKEKKNARG